ncbi:hypothetical protein ACHAWO_002709 [Cyclotella atomus]|uniref:Uncharacterized protein n=1 Tax=Cyclotella atomus TaxID=382360 RepID=A0ABD3NK76_9STRA
MELKDIDPIYVIGVIAGLAIIGAAVLYLQAKQSTKKSSTKKTRSRKSTTPIEVSSPPRIKKDAVGSVSTPAGRRSARIARKAD